MQRDLAEECPDDIPLAVAYCNLSTQVEFVALDLRQELRPLLMREGQDRAHACGLGVPNANPLMPEFGDFNAAAVAGTPRALVPGGGRHVGGGEMNSPARVGGRQLDRACS